MIGHCAAGQLRVELETPMPAPLPPSPFPGISGWADAEPGIASAELDDPDHDLFRLAPNCYIQFELVGADPGISIVTSHVWALGETIDFGPPFFDFHLVFNIYDGAIGSTYTLQFRLRDLNGVYTDSATYTLVFTPVAEACLCRGDMIVDASRSGADIQSFVDCVIGSALGGSISPGCGCADMDGDGALDSGDVDMFVDRLLAPGPCP